MSKPIKEKSSANIRLTLWEGDFQGKPTYSFTLKKNYKKKDGTWANTEFFTTTDLKDVVCLCQSVINNNIKSRNIQQKQNSIQTIPQEKTQEVIEDEDIPF